MRLLPGRARASELGKCGEETVARRVKGRRTPGSGSVVGAEGDVRSDTLLIEVKTTEKLSFSVKYRQLAKIAHEAELKGLTPVFSVVFADGDGSPRRRGEWALVPAWWLREVEQA